MRWAEEVLTLGLGQQERSWEAYLSRVAVCAPTHADANRQGDAPKIHTATELGDASTRWSRGYQQWSWRVESTLGS